MTKIARIPFNALTPNTVRMNSAGQSRTSGKTPIRWEDYLATFTDYLTVQDAKANSIASLRVKGGARLSGTPTPTAPATVIANRGALSYGPQTANLLEVKDANIVVGQYINNAGAVTASLPNMYFQRFIAVKPGTAYTLSTSKALNYANFMEYDAAGTFIKRTLYGSSAAPAGTSVTHTMGDTTAFVIIGSNVDSVAFPSITKDNVKSINWMFAEGTKALAYQAYKAGVSYAGEDRMLLMGKNLNFGKLEAKGYASTGSTSNSSTFCGNLYRIPVGPGQNYTVSWGNLPDGLSGVFINTWKQDGSWNARQAIAAGATGSLTYKIPDGVGLVNFTLYKTGGITIGEDTWMQVEAGSSATDYEPAVEPQVALAVTLLGVGDYTSSQDLITGEFKAAAAVTVLDGTESISQSGSSFTVAINGKLRSKTELLCSHFAYTSATSSAMANLTVMSYASQNIGFRYDACADVEAFRQFLQREYAKGTPVTIVFPTNSAAYGNPQPLANPAGTVTLIRSAAVPGLENEVALKVREAEQEDEAAMPNGVYVQHVDGKLYTADEWTAAGLAAEQANGVAVISDAARFVIGLTTLSKKAMWSSDSATALEGVMLTTDQATALTDMAGRANTETILKSDTSGAAYMCANYTFPNGKAGYLPSLGEWNVVAGHAEAVNQAMSAVGATMETQQYYWSSTQYSDKKAWKMGWTRLEAATGDKSSKYSDVRPFTEI